MKRLLLLTLVLFVLIPPLFAQSKWDGLGIEANLMSGKMIRHTPKFPKIVPDNSQEFEINFVQQTNGRKDWQQRRNYPLLGCALSYTNYGIDSIYGKCFSIYPNIELPIVKGKKLQWTAKAGFGLGYVTKRFSRYPGWDTLNTAIGSHFNNYSYFGTDLRYRINHHWDIQTGLSFSHVSNAALRKPNLGINMYGAHVGVRYFPYTSQPQLIVRTLEPLKNRWLIQARFGISATESGNGDGPLFPIYMASIYASKRYLSKNKAFAGVDYSYHSDVYAFMHNNEVMPGQEKNKSWKSAVFIGNEFLIGRVGILLQLGFYVKKGLYPDVYYEKLGGNVYIIQKEKGILKELFASCLLKAHKTDAELVELGLGVGF